MSNDATDARWPKLLSLAVHEFRTPITVVAGYIRMVLKERAGPISDQQRKLLEEAEKSCGRLSALVAELSELSRLEAGTAPTSLTPVDLLALLRDVIGGLPELPDRTVTVELDAPADGQLMVPADPLALRTSITALLGALRREVVSSDRLVVRPVRQRAGSMSILAIGDPEQIDQVAAAETAAFERFDEWRGGCGLSLAIARRVIGQHGGALFAPPGGAKAGALLMLPAIT